MTSSVVVYAGLLVVISVGVALGVAVGVFFLFAVIACHKRYFAVIFYSTTTTTTTSSINHF